MHDNHWTINHVINRLGRPGISLLPAPPYTLRLDAASYPVGLAVESMKLHTTNEGWELFAGLEHAGYKLHGYRLGSSLTDVKEILRKEHPTVVFVQDPREWDVQPRDFREPRARFTNIEYLKDSGAFIVTVLKDSHQKPEYHREWMDRMGAHAVVHYYQPRIVSHLAPYVRPQHLIRTYHTLDPAHLPAWRAPHERYGAVITGAVSGAYPLRKRLFDAAERRDIDCLAFKHPGYHRSGCHTPEYMRILSSFKVSVCTSSVYGYALRKLIESTAVGCRVITDLPEDEIMPGIDRNLVRIRPDIPTREVGEIIHDLINSYDEELQKNYSDAAIEFYDFRTSGTRLADDIERLRAHYNG